MDKAPYAVAPAPGGALMPDGWKLRDYEMEDNELRRTKTTDAFDLYFSRQVDDGFLLIRTGKLAADDEKKSIDALIERVFVHVSRITDAYFGANYVRIVEGPAPVIVDGAEAKEAIVERSFPGERAAVTRHYVVVLRPRSGTQVVTLYYSNVPATFAAGLPEAKDFVRRLRF